MLWKESIEILSESSVVNWCIPRSSKPLVTSVPSQVGSIPTQSRHKP